jgi:hypothetical protein
MDDSKHIAACMLANALIANQGSRRLAAIEAAFRVDKQPGAMGRAVWTKARDLLRSPNPIPPYRAHIPEIPSPHTVHYGRVPIKGRG